MPYVLSTALVLILGRSRQAHIRFCDLCSPPHQTHTHPFSCFTCSRQVDQHQSSSGLLLSLHCWCFSAIQPQNIYFLPAATHTHSSIFNCLFKVIGVAASTLFSQASSANSDPILRPSQASVRFNLLPINGISGPSVCPAAPGGILTTSNVSFFNSHHVKIIQSCMI